jgi:hypothetical protein
MICKIILHVNSFFRNLIEQKLAGLTYPVTESFFSLKVKDLLWYGILIGVQ